MAGKDLSKAKLTSLIAILVGLNTALLGAINSDKISNKQTPNNQMIVRVMDVIDGDTFVTEEKVRVRLYRVDAPELDMCLGQESKERLIELVKGEETLLKDVMTDKFGRLLAKVFVGDLYVNKTLLEEGLARYGGGDDDEMLQASTKAQKYKMGIYENCLEYENPNRVECSIKGNIEKNNKTKIYHFDGCSGYEGISIEPDFGEMWFCSEKEAQEAGFVKSKQCFGNVSSKTNPNT